MNGDSAKRRRWTVKSSTMSKMSINPIRNIVDYMDLKPNPDKDLISLSIGDPTVFGNLGPCESMKQAVKNAVDKGGYDGYAPAAGSDMSREAVAKRFSTDELPLNPKDVVLASGCSGALEMAVLVLANPGDNILIPRPGFSLYSTLCQASSIVTKQYDLLPEKSWEVDLDHVESLIDENTAGIIVNNPSNPCGSVYSKEHLTDICKVAEKHHIPIISDEVYADMVFSEQTFYSVSSVSGPVPVLTCGGLAKRFLCPGWRMGWILIQDRTGAFNDEVRLGLFNLANRILGPCSILQGAMPDMFDETPQSFYSNAMDVFESNAKLLYEGFSKVPGLHPIMPQGAMYLMCGLKIDQFSDVKDDMDFVQKLMNEESVFCLPAKKLYLQGIPYSDEEIIWNHLKAKVFGYPGYFRVVLSVPKEKVEIALERITNFCLRHSK